MTHRHRVVALVLDTVVPFDLAVPCQVFGWGRPDLGQTRYEFELCGVTPGYVRAAQGFSIEVPIPLWPAPPRRLIRISAQLYNTRAQFARLADALGKELAR